MNKKIVLITSGQPSLNPRLVKEADALVNAGYNIKVIYAYWNTWGTKLDEELLHSKKWTAIRAGGDPEIKSTVYFYSRVLFKLANLFTRLTGNKWLADIVASRSTHFLIREALKHSANMYIAHNLGALPAAVAAAKKYHKPCGFDAEDFHRHEMSNDPKNKDVILRKQIEERYIPEVNYLTTSSPQIAHAYQAIFPQFKPQVILNVFPKSDLQANDITIHQPIKLFWFSQTIGSNRGLHDIVGALRLLNRSGFELHLLGHQPPYSKSFTDEIKRYDINLLFHDPIPPDELVSFASQFDIGLALEPGFSINNNLALSNKIFTYMQAGLAIIASNTNAQSAFISQNLQIGCTYQKENLNELAAALSAYCEHPDNLLACKTASLKLAQTCYNWENESPKFLRLIKNILTD